jgi:CRISPR/Cas system CSM-associated protein Csm4 (group 5 of RAMP superfamily)
LTETKKIQKLSQDNLKKIQAAEADERKADAQRQEEQKIQ